jgi:hypothetical protein
MIGIDSYLLRNDVPLRGAATTVGADERIEGALGAERIDGETTLGAAERNDGVDRTAGAETIGGAE